MTDPIRTNLRPKRPIEIRAKLKALEAIHDKSTVIWTLISALKWTLGESVEII